MKVNFTILSLSGLVYDIEQFCLSKIKFISLLIFLITGLQLSFGQISRDQVISNAQTYMFHQWTATSSNIKSGTSCGGKTIQTPSWVKVGINTAMPYCWGGWTTTASIQGYLNSGKSAGDNNTATSFGAEPSCAVGLDCSGFITRVWGITNTKYSTSTLENISKVINLTSVQPGDILNDAGSHVMLVEINNGNGSYQVIESSGKDWKVSRRTYTSAQLSGYIPRQYNNITGGTLSGYASVSSGIAISPSPVVSGSDFTTSFSLKETKGASITFESIVCAILKSDNTHLRDMEIKGPITISANGTYNYSSTLAWRTTDPTGSYTAVARGKVSGGDWFDFTLSGGTSPLSFNVNQISLPGSFSLTLTPECDGTTSQIRLNWTTSSGATSYDIYRNGSVYASDIIGFQYINRGNITEGISYSYLVKAKNSSGSTNNSNGSQNAVAPGCSCSAPSNPSSLTASIGSPANGLNHHTNLTCTNVSGAEGYSYEYSYNGVDWAIDWFQSASINIDVNNQDQPNLPIYYRVRAYKCTPKQFSSYTYASPQPAYTACDDPVTPLINGISSSSLSVTLSSETPVSNPSYTTYSIYCPTTGQYVQTNGTLGNNEIFQTKSSWSTKTIIGLLKNKEYSFYVKGKNNNGDIRYNSLNVASYIITYIIDINASGKIKIYPNPTTGKFEISGIDALGDKCKIEIFNHLGVSILVSEYETIDKKISLDLSVYPAGMYLIQISNNGVSYQKKVVKK